MNSALFEKRIADGEREDETHRQGRPPLDLRLLLLGFSAARAAIAAPGSREPSRFASRPFGFDPSSKHI